MSHLKTIRRYSVGRRSLILSLTILADLAEQMVRFTRIALARSSCGTSQAGIRADTLECHEATVLRPDRKGTGSEHPVQETLHTREMAAAQRSANDEEWEHKTRRRHNTRLNSQCWPRRSCSILPGKWLGGHDPYDALNSRLFEALHFSIPEFLGSFLLKR